MRLAVCVSAWNEEQMLPACLDSCDAIGLPVIVADGAYRYYIEDGEPWWSTDRTKEVTDKRGAIWLPALAARMWEHEAEKKTALLREAIKARAHWALFLDADERLEYPSGTRTAVDALIGVTSGDLWWSTVGIYRPPPSETYAPFPLPRLIALTDTVEFRPPRDFHIWRDGRRIAFLDGEEIPQDIRDRYIHVSSDLIRIRHDRSERPPERQLQSARYMKRLRTQHGHPDTEAEW